MQGHLSAKDFEKLKRLRRRFDLNYRVTHMYGDYLTNAPEKIKKDMVDCITADNDIRTSDAVAALLSLMFDLHTDISAEDRQIERDYLFPSVRILSPTSYYSDPYMQTVEIPNKKFGRWEFRNEIYAPYRAMICDDILPEADFREVPPLGFFTEAFRFPAVLENENEWMTLSPVDMDTCREAICRARGRVVTFGLGLGYFAFMAARKPEVESVTIVERSPDVIALFRDVLLPQFPEKEKIRIAEDDAFVFAETKMRPLAFDFAFVDTWRDASDGYPMYRRMKPLEKLSPNTEFSYWIEGFLLSRMRALMFEDIWRTESCVNGRSDDTDYTFDILCESLTNAALRKSAEENKHLS